MLNKITLMVVLIISMFFVLSCSEDENPVTPEAKKEAKELNIKEITIPEALKQSSDPHAQMCAGYIALANGLKGYASMYRPPEETSMAKLTYVDDNWTRTWTMDQLTVTMNYFENDATFGWEILLTGTDNQFTYSNWLSMKAEQKIDNSFGTLVIYKPVTDQVEFQWQWSETQTQNTFTMETYDDNGNLRNKIEVVSNTDNSGEVTFYGSANGTFAKQTRITWTSTGTGHWEEYDVSGNITDQGDF